MFTVSSVHSELRDWYQAECSFSKVFMLCTFGGEALNQPLPILSLCTSHKILMVLYFSQLPVFSLLKVQNMPQLFYESKILRDEVFLWYLTELRHWALWKSWNYIWQISSSFLISTSTVSLASGISVSLVFCSMLNRKTDTTEGWPPPTPVLVMCMWKA